MLLITNSYSQIRVNGTWAFPSTDYLKANQCFHQVALQDENLVIPVIFLQRGGPSDDENQAYLNEIINVLHSY